jgi:hypothetical protein
MTCQCGHEAGSHAKLLGAGDLAHETHGRCQAVDCTCPCYTPDEITGLEQLTTPVFDSHNGVDTIAETFSEHASLRALWREQPQLAATKLGELTPSTARDAIALLQDRLGR